MRISNQGRLREQVLFLKRQFLQDGELPFTNVLSNDIVEQALTAAGVVWKDRVYSPLVTLWVFLEQVLRVYPNTSTTLFPLIFPLCFDI